MRNILLLFSLLFLGNLSYGQKKVQERIVESWKNQQWVNSVRNVYTYNSNGKIDFIILYGWDKNAGTWIKRFKTQHTYNSQGLLIEETESRWSKTSNNWISPESRIVRTYNANGNETKILHEVKLTGSLEGVFRVNKAYTNGKLTTLVEEETVSGQWRKKKMVKSSYNGQGLLKKEETKKWAAATSTWMDETVEEFFYKANNKKDYSVVQSVASGTPINFFKYTYEYDANDYLIVNSKLNWNKNSNMWMIEEKYSHKNLADGSVEQTIKLAWSSFTIKLDNVSRTTYKYDDNTAVKEISNLSEEQVYPNPTKGILNLDRLMQHDFNASVDVIDINGKVIRHYSTVQNTIDVSELPNGVYFLKQSTQTGLNTIRFIKN